MNILDHFLIPPLLNIVNDYLMISKDQVKRKYNLRCSIIKRGYINRKYHLACMLMINHNICYYALRYLI